MVTPTGLESLQLQAVTSVNATLDASGGGSTQTADASRRDATEPDGWSYREPPSAVPSFIEACAKLAAFAAGRGDMERALALVEMAAKAGARGDA